MASYPDSGQVDCVSETTHEEGSPVHGEEDKLLNTETEEGCPRVEEAEKNAYTVAQ